MPRIALPTALLALAFLLTAATSAGAQQYQFDGAHSSYYFRIGHVDVSLVYGRFNDVTGDFNLGDDPSFNFTVKTASVDTGNQKRDEHLRSPDFFNARQFPEITFKSTNVSETDAGYDVTGELSLHGVTNTVTVPLRKVGEADFPPGTPRVGFATEFTINRSDYGMTNMLDVVGDEVELMISFEGIEQ